MQKNLVSERATREGRSVTPLFTRFLEAAFVYLLGAAIAAGIAAKKSGWFRWGMWAVVIPTIAQACFLLPMLYMLGQKHPVVHMMGFGVAFLIASPLIGAAAGAKLGVTLHRREPATLL